MILSSDAYEAFKADVLARYPEEACGLIVNGSYISMPNIAADPTETFRIDPIEYVKHSLNGLQALLHSHPYKLEEHTRWPAQWPTTADMKGWMNTGIPWGIVSTEGEGISQLVWLDENNPEPLIGREFIHGVNDCYSIIRDWFKLERGITLINKPRGMEWWGRGENIYELNLDEAGFVEVPMAEATVGDCVLFKIRSRVENHAAVITGTNQILHHMIGALSGHDSLARHSRLITRAVRYVGEQPK